MALYEFEGKVPKIGKDAFIHPDSVIIGDVEIGEKCYIGAAAVMRGDHGRIVIGDGTNVQDGAVIHAEPETVAMIGKNCLIAHQVMVHGPVVIHDGAMIGMSAIVLAHTELGEGCAIAAGSLIREKTKVPAGRMMAGLPAREVGPVSERAAAFINIGVEWYQGLAARSIKGMKRID